MNKSCFHALIASLLVLLFSLVKAAENKAIVVGISQYQEGLPKLHYADNDAEQFSTRLRNSVDFENEDNISVLLNGNATRANIMREVEKVVRQSKQRPLRKFIFFFSGHGSPSRIGNQSTTMFLAPADASDAETSMFTNGSMIDNETYIKKAWLASQLVQLNAESIIVIIDSCHSGITDFGQQIASNLEGRVISVASNDVGGKGLSRVYEMSYNSPGLGNKKIVFFASSAEQQKSYEYHELKNGVLTYSFVKAIDGAGAEIYKDQSTALTVKDSFEKINSTYASTRIGGRVLASVQQPVLHMLPSKEAVANLDVIRVIGLKEREARSGRLALDLDGVSAEVTVDGDRIGVGAEFDLKLGEGRHYVDVYVADTKYKHTFGVDIANGRTTQKFVPMYGTLEVNSYWKGEYGEGPSVDAYVDRSQHSSGSKIKWRRLLAGAHELQMSVSGERVSRNIEIRPDSPLKVNLRVEKRAVAEDRQDAADAALMP